MSRPAPADVGPARRPGLVQFILVLVILLLLAVVVGLVLVMGCGMGFGVGPGDGEGTESGITPVVEPITPPAEVEVPVSTTTGTPVRTTDVVTVLIDGESYGSLKLGGDPRDKDAYEPATLDAIAAAAKTVTGDYGTTVRILRRNTATPQAEQSLREALTAAGVASTAIKVDEEVVY